MNEFHLWPGCAPGGDAVPTADPPNDPVDADGIVRLRHVRTPTLTAFPVASSGTAAPAMIVCPGGGYHLLAWDLEGTEIAAWLNSIGVTAFVLKYRVPSPDRTVPLQDAQRALALVRHRAAEWNVDPSRIGMIGFSAGAHIATSVALQERTRAYPALDDADAALASPDFLALVYPSSLGHPSRPGSLSPALQRAKAFPPTFIAVTQDDDQRALHASLLYARLHRVRVPTELHIYPRGGHGYGIRKTRHPVSTWHHRCAEWLHGLR